MDKRYAHMFKGKNRMFEVQVQGRFKKPPDGELYISLEITDRMKLGLLTKVMVPTVVAHQHQHRSCCPRGRGCRTCAGVPALRECE